MAGNPSLVMRTGPMPVPAENGHVPRPDSKVERQAPLSNPSLTPSGSLLTGKQEHYLKRELISREVHAEILDLSTPSALQRFGAPFRSDFGEVSPLDSEFPILRYIFVNHVRNFPFLDKANEKEFWQDKLQVFLESFASKYISSSEDRLEETKRKKLAKKCEKLVELMMVSGVPTASGYEERIRFSDLEVVDASAQEHGLLNNVPEGNYINGWDVNVAGVRTTSVKRTVRYHQHAEFLIRVRKVGRPDIYVGRRYGEFSKLHKRLRLEMAGKVLPPLPRKNKTSTTAGLLGIGGGDDDDTSSISSRSTQDTPGAWPSDDRDSSSLRSLMTGHRRYGSKASASGTNSPRASPSPAPQDRKSGEHSPARPVVHLHREEQRVSLRAFLRTFLQNPQIAESRAMADFLTLQPLRLNEEELEDIARRKEMDARRIEEQAQFYEIARQRAAELDVYMERFRRDVVETNGLTKLFAEIKQKEKIEHLSIEYQKFAEWLRIEVAATLYHIFLAEDNSPELFAQAKRIHSLLPYVIMKNVIRIANPAAVMAGVLDLFLAQPFGARSLLQRIFSQTLSDGIKSFQKTIDGLVLKIGDPVLCQKLKTFVDAPEATKNLLRQQAASEQVDLVVEILRSEHFPPDLTAPQIGKVFNAYVAWTSAVENVDEELKQGAELFSQLKELLKLLTRQRDKAMMAKMIEEPTTLQLFRDLFTIFYEPLVRVYKSANVYSSITDFAVFADDVIKTIESAQRQDVSADPNQTVQMFIDVCARHEHNFYKFVHEVHLHDNGLFGALMGWIEGILEFLRHGPKAGRIDMNAIFQGGVASGLVDKQKCIDEIDQLIEWQRARKRWHQDKTRQKMAAEGSGGTTTGELSMVGGGGFSGSDFGLHEEDLREMNMDSADDSSSDEEANENLDPITAERRRRSKARDRLRRTAGEPVKPDVVEIPKLKESFVTMLRVVLSE